MIGSDGVMRSRRAHAGRGLRPSAAEGSGMDGHPRESTQTGKNHLGVAANPGENHFLRNEAGPRQSAVGGGRMLMYVRGAGRKLGDGIDGNQYMVTCYVSGLL